MGFRNLQEKLENCGVVVLFGGNSISNDQGVLNNIGLHIKAQYIYHLPYTKNNPQSKHALTMTNIYHFRLPICTSEMAILAKN